MPSRPVAAVPPLTIPGGQPSLGPGRSVESTAARPGPPPVESNGSAQGLGGTDEANQSPLWATQQVHRYWRGASSCLISMVVHALLVILMGLRIFGTTGGGGPPSLVASALEGPEQDSLEAQQFDAEASSGQLLSESAISAIEQISAELAESVAKDAQGGGAATASPANDNRAASDSVTDALRHLPAGTLGGGEMIGSGYADVSGALAGRGAEARQQLALQGGGNKDSEDAVSRGLRWLQVHQRVDGSWSFDLKQKPCEGHCSNSGSEPSATGATGLALLAFLGRGETHFEGDYQETVKRGVYYLTSQMLITGDRGDLRGAGNMYSHGIATIALCEAYAMTHDKALEPFAQQAINFILWAQDERGGGWRYEPGMPGDTTVTGWQIMALKSGQMGYLRVPFESLERASRFLDSVQVERGARYGYLPRLKEGKELTTSSVGLLCRMYLGWSKEQPSLRKGVDLLAREGPSMLGSSANMYYNYYATQIMHQYGGEPWETWNNRMRDFLVSTQAREGHESGSWYFDGGQARAGGRLYVTAAAIMTLEVYYRHMPLYAAHAVGY